MTISADDVFKKHMTATQRKKAKARSDELIAEYKTLQELRKARALTQVRLAEILGVTQDNVSRIEKRSDVLLSTLRSYIEAMGGELDLVVTFPDHAPVHLKTLSDLNETPPR
ncbi:XRE family transcriptional regulator [Breoghania sp. L-A4]|uniref:helix-turn-helix domain-containing protein n=1 Tax=Breoghania sp. L-A4 TaxID=2304600 RepID=UPI000E35B59B|nr:XRE family transcriptional regulator [Breoghania sp. L-A4]AXS41626.1 helix-turn-helix domain-containing protein [Breoghania sp. L-A4]